MTFKLNPGQQRAYDETLRSGKRFNLIYGGSRSGKTALYCSAIQDRALYAPGSRHLIVRKEGTAAKRAIVKDTFPAIWRMKFPEVSVPQWKEQYGYFEFPNGSEVWVGGLNDEKALEKILGNEYATIYANEASEVEYTAWLLLRSRLAQTSQTIENTPLSQRMYADLNPTTRMHWTYRLWREGMDPQDNVPIDRTQYAFSVINPYDNMANLSGEYLADLEALPARQRKRFLEGEYVSDDENALWRREYIKRSVVKDNGDWPVEMQRIVIAIDPAVSNAPGSDETGIIAMGLGVDGRGYVLEDESGRYRPEEWARRAVSLYHSLDADRVVAETNQGGDMVEATLRAVDPTIPYTSVRGKGSKKRLPGDLSAKVMRAEPVAALYERGRIMHVGEFTDLEDQMCSVTTGFDPKVAGWSPDRVDALVWAATALFPQLSRKTGVGGKISAPAISIA